MQDNSGNDNSMQILNVSRIIQAYQRLCTMCNHCSIRIDSDIVKVWRNRKMNIYTNLTWDHMDFIMNLFNEVCSFFQTINCAHWSSPLRSLRVRGRAHFPSLQGWANLLWTVWAMVRILVGIAWSGLTRDRTNKTIAMIRRIQPVT